MITVTMRRWTPFLAGCAFFVALSLTVATGLGQGRGGPAAVAVAKVQDSSDEATPTFVGTAAPIKHSIIGSAVEGRLVEVLYDEGEYIDPAHPRLPSRTSNADLASTDSEASRGEGSQRDSDSAVDAAMPDDDPWPIVAQLRTGTLEIEIAAAESELILRQQELVELQASIPEEIALTRSNIESATAASKYADQRYTRMENLFRQNRTATQEQLDEALSIRDAATNALKARESELRRLEATVESRLAQAQAKVESQRQAVNRLHDLMRKYSIRAPFAGYITVQHAEVGAWISSGDPVIEIVKLDPIELRVMIPSAYVNPLETVLERKRLLGEKLEVPVEFSSMPGVPFTGTVQRVVPQSDLRSRAFPVLIHVENPEQDGRRRLKSGMLARVALPVGEGVARLMVPKDALVLNGERRSVVVVDYSAEQPTARVVSVQIGESLGSQIAVSGDLEAGQEVVVEGNERLRDGQILRVVKSTDAS